jgi:2-keto-4-pentenoate hydratase/2-oxohepta-3-ene-1,7-dioic acid hydratase (catechol pathway)
MPLAAGDIVTTGTWTGLTAVRPVEEMAAVFPGIGEARLRLEH